MSEDHKIIARRRRICTIVSRSLYRSQMLKEKKKIPYIQRRGQWLIQSTILQTHTACKMPGCLRRSRFIIEPPCRGSPPAPSNAGQAPFAKTHSRIVGRIYELLRIEGLYTLGVKMFRRKMYMCSSSLPASLSIPAKNLVLDDMMYLGLRKCEGTALSLNDDNSTAANLILPNLYLFRQSKFNLAPVKNTD